jgi:hypothetical protein
MIVFDKKYNLKHKANQKVQYIDRYRWARRFALQLPDRPWASGSLGPPIDLGLPIAWARSSALFSVDNAADPENMSL